MTAVQQTDSAGYIAGRPALIPPLRILAPLIALLVLVQAFLAGRGLFLSDVDAIDIHGWLGSAVFLLVVVQVALVLLAGLRGRARMGLLGMSLLLLVLVVAQLGLGYSGREGGQAAAWHIPNGVLIFGITVGNATLTYRLRPLQANTTE
jgi:hypothetical protein